jgi:hypothetical protein
MKRTVLLLMAIAVVSSIPAHAQRPGLFGVSGGATLGDIGLTATTTDSRWGGTAGVFGAWRASYNTIVTLEANWVQKGGKGLGGESLRLDYIDIPLTFGGSAAMADQTWRGRLYVGVSLGVRVGCDSDVPGLNCDRANSTDWTFPIGGMLAKTSPDGRLVGVDVRYSIGASDVFDNTRSKTRLWQFKLIVGFPKG